MLKEINISAICVGPTAGFHSPSKQRIKKTTFVLLSEAQLPFQWSISRMLCLWNSGNIRQNWSLMGSWKLQGYRPLSSHIGREQLVAALLHMSVAERWCERGCEGGGGVLHLHQGGWRSTGIQRSRLNPCTESIISSEVMSPAKVCLSKILNSLLKLDESVCRLP